MRVLVTGGTGFLGRHVVRALVGRNVHPVILVRSDAAQPFSDLPEGSYTLLQADMESFASDEKSPIVLDGVEHAFHLAWSGLPRYKEMFHIEDNLMVQYHFIKSLIRSGIRDITITGTCLEYGMREGCLHSEDRTDPVVPYAIAKDALRRFLFQLHQRMPFRLKWLRLFYTYGEGQSENSLLRQLQRALDRGDAEFNMSPGDQLRDYLPVGQMADRIVRAGLDLNRSGIFNCCSGQPVSVSTLVEDYIARHGGKIRLNKGYYPYPDYEPHSFWGHPDLTS